MGSTMFERRVQRCSLVDGGSSPGTMKGPIVPASKRIVSCGAKRRCASVAASSGTPMPAKTIWPFVIRREAITARSSDVVKVEVGFVCLVIMHAPSAAAGVEQSLHAELRQIIGPALRSVIKLIEILLRTLHRVLRADLGVIVEMLEEGLVKPVAFVRRAAERRLDHRIHGEERDARAIGGAADLIIAH